MLDHIGTELRERRRGLGLSQAQVAARAGLRQSYYSRIELGKVEPRFGTLVDIARAMNLELALVPAEALPAVAAIVRPAAGHQEQRLFAATGD